MIGTGLRGLLVWVFLKVIRAKARTVDTVGSAGPSKMIRIDAPRRRQGLMENILRKLRDRYAAAGQDARIEPTSVGRMLLVDGRPVVEVVYEGGRRHDGCR